MRICKHYEMGSNNLLKSLIKPVGGKGRVFGHMYICKRCSRQMSKPEYELIMRHIIATNVMLRNNNPLGDHVRKNIWDETRLHVPARRAYDEKEKDPINPEINPFFYK